MTANCKIETTTDEWRVGELPLGSASVTSIALNCQKGSSNAKNTFEAVDTIRHAAFVIKSLRSSSSSMRFVKAGSHCLFYMEKKMTMIAMIAMMMMMIAL